MKYSWTISSAVTANVYNAPTKIVRPTLQFLVGPARMGPIFAIMDLCSTVHPQKAQMMHKIFHSPSLLILTRLFRRGNPIHNHSIANIQITLISKVCRRACPMDVRIIVSCWITWCLSSC